MLIGGTFDLRNFALSMDLSQKILLKSTTSCESREDVKHLSVLAHEVHHWIVSNCSTFGTFVGVFRIFCIMREVEMIGKITNGGKLEKPFLEAGAIDPESLANLMSRKYMWELLSGVRNDKLDVMISCKEMFSNFFDGSLLVINQRTLPDHTHIEKASDHFTAFLLALDALIETDLTIKARSASHLCLGWIDILEGHASYVETSFDWQWSMLVDRSITEMEMHDKYLESQSLSARGERYQILMKVMMDIFNTHGYICDELVNTLLVIVDIAENPELDPCCLVPIISKKGLEDFLPQYRFVNACEMLAKHAHELVFHDMPDDPFGTLEEWCFILTKFICERMHWLTPQAITENWLAYHKGIEGGRDLGFELFLRGCSIRKEIPHFFCMPFLPFLDRTVDRRSEGLSHSTFFNVLAKFGLTIRYTGAEGERNLYIGNDDIQRAEAGLFCVLAIGEVVHQILHEDGPVLWEKIVGNGATGEILKKGLIEQLAGFNINLDNIEIARD